MIKTENLDTIRNRELFSMMGKVALPIALQSLIGSSLSFIDNLMVGSLGELELNAVGVSGPGVFHILDAAFWIHGRHGYIHITVLWCDGF